MSARSDATPPEKRVVIALEHLSGTTRITDMHRGKRTRKALSLEFQRGIELWLIQVNTAGSRASDSNALAVYSLRPC